MHVERAGEQILKLLSAQGEAPDAGALAAARSLLLDIEKWKAMCLHDRMGNAERNPPRRIWNAFRRAVYADDDLATILAIMDLKGFGSSQDEETGQRRAKVATAALRFLKPNEWGVVDWRTIAILGYLDKGTSNVDAALNLARRDNAVVLRSLLDIVDEDAACEVMQKYRMMRSAAPLARAADIDMALFGLSLMAWPLSRETDV